MLPPRPRAPVNTSTPSAANNDSQAVSAGQRVEQHDRRLKRQRRIVDAYLAATRHGDFDALVTLLEPGVVLRADRQAGPTPEPVVLHGIRAVARGAVTSAVRARITDLALIGGSLGLVMAPRGGWPASTSGWRPASSGPRARRRFVAGRLGFVTASEMTRARVAQGDSWQVQGRLREPYGGGVLESAGIRLMASGLPHAQWNNGDVDDPDAVDIAAVRDWYARRNVPWGVRVPAGMPWHAGTMLFRKRLMSRPAGPLAPSMAGMALRAASLDDLDAVVRVDSSAFDDAPDTVRSWIEPHFGSPAVTVGLAELDGEPVGTAYTILSSGRAGACVFLGGVAVRPDARRRGVAGALSAWLLARGFASGATLAHLNPDDDGAARVYARLGFVEQDGFDVYVDV
jgi:GNAT superfamily N-acetyltransferase